MIRRSACLGALVAASLLCAAAPAGAQDMPAAEALFKLALKEMNAGHYDKACPAIAESQRLDPRPGTLFTLAECEAKRGRVATALTHYRDYLALYAHMAPEHQQGHAKRAGIAEAQVGALGPQVPEIAISLAADAPSGATVKRDGVTLPAAALGVGLPIDPGEHVIRTEAPGAPASEVRVTIGTGEKKALVVGAKAAEAAPPAAPVAAPGTSGRRVGAWVAGGVGAVGIALGAAMGGLTLAKKATIDRDCGVHGVATDCRTQAGAAAGESAKTTGLVSTLGFGVGIAGVGTAIVLWATAPRARKPSAAWIRPTVVALDGTGAALGVRGEW